MYLLQKIKYNNIMTTSYNKNASDPHNSQTDSKLCDTWAS